MRGLAQWLEPVPARSGSSACSTGNGRSLYENADDLDDAIVEVAIDRVGFEYLDLLLDVTESSLRSPRAVPADLVAVRTLPTDGVAAPRDLSPPRDRREC